MAGNSGSGSKRDKLIREALTLAAKRVIESDPQGRIALAIAAEKVVMAAVDGDLAAFKEMADRIDGKSIQATEGTLDVNIHDGAKERLDRKLASLAKRLSEEGSAERPH